MPRKTFFPYQQEQLKEFRARDGDDIIITGELIRSYDLDPEQNQIQVFYKERESENDQSTS